MGNVKQGKGAIEAGMEVAREPNYGQRSYKMLCSYHRYPEGSIDREKMKNNGWVTYRFETLEGATTYLNHWLGWVGPDRYLPDVEYFFYDDDCPFEIRTIKDQVKPNCKEGKRKMIGEREILLLAWIAENIQIGPTTSRLFPIGPIWNVNAVELLDKIQEIYNLDRCEMSNVIDPIRERLENKGGG